MNRIEPSFPLFCPPASNEIIQGVIIVGIPSNLGHTLFIRLKFEHESWYFLHTSFMQGHTTIFIVNLDASDNLHIPLRYFCNAYI